MDEHLADLLGLDPTDPTVQASVADADTLMDLITHLVRRREQTGLTQQDVAAAMETSVAAVADFERAGGDPTLSFAQRYARAVGASLDIDISEEPDYGQAVSAPLTDEQAAALYRDLADGTVPRRKATVLDDDEPGVANPRTRAAVEQMRQERQATPERDGYTIGVYLPPGISEAVRDKLADQIADAAHDADDGADWDAHVVGLPGDVCGAVDGMPRP